jgi:hypothetical protein
MPIETICKGCARKLRVPDEHAGKKARCPQCGLIYVVPGSPAASTPTTPPTDKTASETPASAPQEAKQSAQVRWQLRTTDGRVFGPVPKRELDEWYAEGRIPADAMLLSDGDPQWRSASEVYPQLAGTRRGLHEQGNPFSDAATPTRSSTAYHVTSARHQLPHRGGVILTLAILGWVICPVFAPFAWSMGAGDLRAMRLGQMDTSGQSMTQAGMIVGMIQTILVGLFLAVMCFGAFS